MTRMNVSFYMTIGVKKDWVLGNIASCRTGFVVFTVIFTMSMMDTSSLCFLEVPIQIFSLIEDTRRKTYHFLQMKLNY